MKRAPAAPTRRLVPLAVGVLAVHLVLLQLPTRDLAATPPPGPRFATRTIAPAPPTVEAPPALPAEVPAPSKLEVPRATPSPTAPVKPRAASPDRAAAAALAAVRPRRSQAPDSRPTPSETVLAQASPVAAPMPAPVPARLAAASASAPAVPNTAVLAASAASGPPAASQTEAAPPPATLPQVVLLPPPARFHYEVIATFHGLPLRGEGEISWRQDGHSYELQMDARSPVLLGTRRQRSAGRITEQGLVPDDFYDRARSEQATHFERQKGLVTFSNNHPDAPWTAGIQDRLSVVLQLAVIIGGQPERYPPGTQITVPTASTREAETWFFTVEGEEDLQLPGGTVHALKLQRVPRRQYDVKVELWLAPRMDYAPVRLRLTNPNGDTVDQRWSSTDKG
jgi:hypothetical protein